MQWVSSTPRLRAKSAKSVSIAVNILGVVDQVDLVHHQDDVRHPQQGRDSQMPTVCSTTPLRASTSSTMTSAVEEPVTVFRVVHVPWASARMNYGPGS